MRAATHGAIALDYAMPCGVPVMKSIYNPPIFELGLIQVLTYESPFVSRGCEIAHFFVRYTAPPVSLSNT